MYGVVVGDWVFVFLATDAACFAFDGEEGFFADGSDAHGAFFGAIEIALAVMCACREIAPRIADDQVFTFDFLGHGFPLRV